MKWKSWSGWRSTCLKRQYQFHEEKETQTHHEDASGTELIGVINNIQEVNDEIDMTSLTLSANTLWEHQEKAVNLGDAAIAFISSLKLLPLCDHILQATDAGPRVGAFKTLRCQGFNTRTNMNRIHRAPHDSGQNEAERSRLL